jgi:plasmid segregation protein ParM
MTYVLGLDIGYSNLKTARGEIGAGPFTTMVPSGAAPEERLPHGIHVSDQGKQIYVDNEIWRVGLGHGRFDLWQRSLHGNYTETKTYRALFYAALSECAEKKVDRLVTGLPVKQWIDSKNREALTKSLIGSHLISPGKKVIVSKVDVVPQPLGAYLDMYWQQGNEADVLSEGRVLVIDPGFYSVDWVILDGGALRQSASGSSLDAMSVLLQETSRLIAESHEGTVNIDRLEEALRTRRNRVFLFGNEIDLSPYLAKASLTVGRQALEALQQSIRREVGSVDIVILAGGGAMAYQQCVREEFSRSKVLMNSNPELANARGFYYYGEM